MNRRTLTQAPNPHAAPPVSTATRRDLFGTMGAMLLLTAAEAGPAKAAELDGELLRAGTDLRSTNREIASAEADDNVCPADEDFAALCDRRSDLLATITMLPVRTPEGLRAKAEALCLTLMLDVPTAEPDGTWESDAQPHDRLAMSLCRDLLGRIGA